MLRMMNLLTALLITITMPGMLPPPPEPLPDRSSEDILSSLVEADQRLTQRDRLPGQILVLQPEGEEAKYAGKGDRENPWWRYQNKPLRAYIKPLLSLNKAGKALPYRLFASHQRVLPPKHSDTGLPAMPHKSDNAAADVGGTFPSPKGGWIEPSQPPTYHAGRLRAYIKPLLDQPTIG